MRKRNLIIVADADDLAMWRGYLRERVAEEPKRAAPAQLLAALESLRDGGNLKGTPYEEAPESPPAAQQPALSPDPTPGTSRAAKATAAGRSGG